MPAIQNNPIINATAANAQAVAANTQAGLAVAKQLDLSESLSLDMTDAVSRASSAEQIISSQTESFKAETDAEKSAAALKLGTSWRDPASRSNYWAGEMQRNADLAYSARDAVYEKRSKTLLSDPLGFIEAQFTLPADIETYNYYADRYNLAEENLNEISRAGSEAAITAERMQKSTSQEIALAKGTQAAALSKINVDKILLDAAGTRIKGVLELSSLSAQQSQLAYQALNADNEQKRLVLAQQSAADQAAMRKLAFAQRQDQLDQKTQDRQNLEAALAERNAGARARGYYTLDNVQQFSREFAARRNDPSYQDMISTGQLITMNKGSVSGVMMGQNAGEVARNYASPGVNTKGNAVATYLAQVWDMEKAKPEASKKPEEFTAAVDKVATAGAQTLLGRIKDGEPNIYAAPPPSVLLKQTATKSNPFLVATVVPMVEQNPEMKLDDNLLVAKAIDFVKQNPQGNFNVAAAGVAAYYRQAVLTNNMMNRYKENGLPEQQKYNAVINGKVVNLADETSVKTAIIQQQFKEGARTFFGANTSGIIP